MSTTTDRDEDEFVKIARLGIDAETFMATPLGKFLASKADAEMRAATEALIGADPADVKANTELRNQIHVSRMFLTWIDDSINAGRAAHHQLREMESLTGS